MDIGIDMYIYKYIYIYIHKYVYIYIEQIEEPMASPHLDHQHSLQREHLGQQPVVYTRIYVHIYIYVCICKCIWIVG